MNLLIENLTKTYQSGGRELTVLHAVSFELQAADTFAIVGPSGSGKTTLLGLCAGLDRASSGSVKMGVKNMVEGGKGKKKKGPRTVRLTVSAVDPWSVMKMSFLMSVAIGIATIPAFARITRSGALGVMSSEYVVAARAAGRSPLAIAWRNVLPNVAGLVIVQASVSFAIAILAEAALAYLGLGTPTGQASWGRMLYEAQTTLRSAPHLALIPGGAIALSVLGFNLFGDGLRDRLDPKLESR